MLNAPTAALLDRVTLGITIEEEPPIECFIISMGADF